MSLKKHINDSRLPKHIAIIMDGNGRWQKSKVWPEPLGMKMVLKQ